MHELTDRHFICTQMRIAVFTHMMIVAVAGEKHKKITPVKKGIHSRPLAPLWISPCYLLTYFVTVQCGLVYNEDEWDREWQYIVSLANWQPKNQPSTTTSVSSNR